MSYILDALKKSEQERRRGEVPEITRFEAVEVQQKSSLKIWPVLLGVLLAIHLLLLGLWLGGYLGGSASVKSAVEPEITAADTGQDELTASSALSAKAADSAKPDRNGVRIKPLAQQADQQAYRQPVPAHERPYRAPKPKVNKVPIASKSALNSADLQAAAKAMGGELITPDSNRSASANNAASKAEPTLPQTSYLPKLQELPARIQGRVPDLNFSSHMYSSEPRFRSIIINGRRLKEGQFVNNELQVREITDKGVVLGLGADVFEVDVLGQWTQ